MRHALRHAGSCDMLIHLGDGLGDGLSVAEEFSLTFHGVSGNEDFAYRAEYASEKLIHIYSRAFFLVHGHQMDLNPYHSRDQWLRHISSMAAWAKRRTARVFLFGHSHLPLLEHKDDIIICNPGDMCFGSATPPRFVLIDAGERMVTFKAIQQNTTGDWEITRELRKDWPVVL